MGGIISSFLDFLLGGINRIIKGIFYVILGTGNV